MESKERLQKIIDNEGLNAKTFSEKLGFERPQIIYDILKNKTKTISDNLSSKIISVFPHYSKYWLLTGEGEMLLTSSPVQTVTGDGNHDNNMINSCSTTAVEKLIIEMSEQRKTYAAIIDKLIDKLQK